MNKASDEKTVKDVLNHLGTPKLTDLAGVICDLPVSDLLRKERVVLRTGTIPNDEGQWQHCFQTYQVDPKVLRQSDSAAAHLIETSRTAAVLALVRKIDKAFAILTDGDTTAWRMVILRGAWLVETSSRAAGALDVTVFIDATFAFERIRKEVPVG